MIQKIIVYILSSIILQAQTVNHQATLTWQDAANPTGTTYNIYRVSAVCLPLGSNQVFTKIATSVTGLTFVDTTVTVGNYCYQITANLNGVESTPSISAGTAIPLSAPTDLTVVGK